MAHVLVMKHVVEDYAKWKTAFDDARETRRAAGEKTYQIFLTKDEPRKLTLLFEWHDLDRAREYFGSEELRTAMKRAGVVGQAEVHFLETIEEGSL
jgi:quinol monooxygenase YgiN